MLATEVKLFTSVPVGYKGFGWKFIGYEIVAKLPGNSLVFREIDGVVQPCHYDINELPNSVIYAKSASSSTTYSIGSYCEMVKMVSLFRIKTVKFLFCENLCCFFSSNTSNSTFFASRVTLILWFDMAGKSLCNSHLKQMAIMFLGILGTASQNILSLE